MPPIKQINNCKLHLQIFFSAIKPFQRSMMNQKSRIVDNLPFIPNAQFTIFHSKLSGSAETAALHLQSIAATDWHHAIKEFAFCRTHITKPNG